MNAVRHSYKENEFWLENTLISYTTLVLLVINMRCRKNNGVERINHKADAEFV